jgi:hypothetical protein
MTLITLSGRRWNTHGSSKEGSGKEAGSEKASQKGGSKEEIISSYYTKNFFAVFLILFSGPCSARRFYRRLFLGGFQTYSLVSHKKSR